MKKRLAGMLAGLLPMLIMIVMANLAMTSSQRLLSRVISINIIVVLMIALLILVDWGRIQHLSLNKLYFLSVTIALVISVGFLIQNQNYLLMPLLFSLMLVAVIMDKFTALLWHVGSVVMIGIVTGQGLVFYSYYLILGFMGVYIIRFIRERSQMVWGIGIIALSSVILHSLLSYVIVAIFRWQDALLSLAMSGVYYVLVVGSLPLLESMFNVMTPQKMMEYTGSNHKLLQRMLVEAPGTYHHVHMVSSLAERAAENIGADAYTAKAGALFHDIGKMKSPMYFIENQNGRPNPHDELAADASARIIIDHVAYGVKMGQEHKLPENIIDIIKTHHGTSLMTYFYHKAVNYNDGVSYDPADFSYSGPKPQSREAGIVMLADCVEAYVRSLGESERTSDRIGQVIADVINIKIKEDQLSESSLTIGELTLIREGFLQVFNGLYHDRIKYPGNKEEA